MLDIVTLGDEVLRQKAAVVGDIDGSIAKLAENMIRTMQEAPGIGLAAPQVGVLKRMFVCQIEGDKPRVFINPEIIGTSEERGVFEEGCLSIPGIYADVLRPDEISIQAWNERGRPFTLNAGGLLARVIQHEYDHLQGVLFLDHLNQKKSERLEKQYYKSLRA
jgi:peptide deformylase